MATRSAALGGQTKGVPYCAPSDGPQLWAEPARRAPSPSAHAPAPPSRGAPRASPPSAPPPPPPPPPLPPRPPPPPRRQHRPPRHPRRTRRPAAAPRPRRTRGTRPRSPPRRPPRHLRAALRAALRPRAARLPRLLLEGTLIQGGVCRPRELRCQHLADLDLARGHLLLPSGVKPTLLSPPGQRVRWPHLQQLAHGHDPWPVRLVIPIRRPVGAVRRHARIAQRRTALALLLLALPLGVHLREVGHRVAQSCLARASLEIATRPPSSLLHAPHQRHGTTRQLRS